MVQLGQVLENHKGRSVFLILNCPHGQLTREMLDMKQKKMNEFHSKLVMRDKK